MLKHYTNRKEYKAYYEGLFKYTFYNMHSIIEKFNKLQDLILSAKYDTIISRDELNLKFEMTKKEIIKKHESQYSIWLASDGRWKTKVPDETKKSGYRLIAKSNQTTLYDEIVKWYTKPTIPKTLEQLFPSWIHQKATETSEANANKLMWVWNTYYESSKLVNKNITELKVIDVKNWFLETIKAKELTGRKFKEMKSVLNMMLDYAIELEITSKNVSRSVRNISHKLFATDYKKSDAEQVYMGDEEEQLITICLSQFEKTKNVAYLAICLNTALALRVGELVALKTGDFCDLSVHIHQQEIKTYVENNGKYIRQGYSIADYTKTPESDRIIPLTSVARYFFNKIVSFNHSRQLESEYLLLDKQGNRLNNDSINNALRRVNKKMNTTQKGNHSIRKTCLSKMNESMVLTNEEIRKFAGHKHISTTQNNYFFSTQDTLSRINNYEKAINGTNINVTQCNLAVQTIKKVGNLKL